MKYYIFIWGFPGGLVGKESEVSKKLERLLLLLLLLSRFSRV